MATPTAQVEVRRSALEGLGLFARVAFRAGEYIDAVEYEREVTAACPIDPARGERFEHCAYPNGKVMLVAFPGRHMNPSCDPNAYYRFHGGESAAYARRSIAVGDEITVDYLINNAGGDSWPCHCGSERCRGETGRSFFELPAAFQHEYRPLLAPWFVDQFRAEIEDFDTRS